ncbi:MAG: hypothetical protein RJA70_617 [Pseudomonadota bacterium]|jgi:hypothetical protein
MVLAALLGACAPERAVTRAASTPAIVPPGEVELAQEGESPRQLDADAALTEVARRRGLAVKHRVRLAVLDRVGLGLEVQRLLRAQVPEKVSDGQTLLLEMLGLVPPGFDYLEETLRLMESQLAGFYDPARSTMFIADDLDAEAHRLTLHHELVHALQDQHYDLGQLTRYGVNTSDVRSALHALAEGDATSVMSRERALEWLADTAVDDDLRQRFAGSFGQGVDAPGILIRSAVAPYVDGLLFVNSLRRQGGWEAVEDAWRNPPKSTEQLLHMEKYSENELPEPVERPRAPAACRVLYDDVLGEQSLRLVFEEWMPAARAAALASGWSGDRATIWSCASGPKGEWALLFDAGKDVAQVGAVLSDALGSCDAAAPVLREVLVEGRAVRVRLSRSTSCPDPGVPIHDRGAPK